jgi:hypothetical protein
MLLEKGQIEALIHLDPNHLRYTVVGSHLGNAKAEASPPVIPSPPRKFQLLKLRAQALGSSHLEA